MEVAGGTTNRIKHCADIFMGVEQTVWGQGGLEINAGAINMDNADAHTAVIADYRHR